MLPTEGDTLQTMYIIEGLETAGAGYTKPFLQHLNYLHALRDAAIYTNLRLSCVMRHDLVTLLALDKMH